MREDRAMIALGIAIVVVVAGVAAYIVVSGPRNPSPPPLRTIPTGGIACVTPTADANWTTYHGNATRAGAYAIGPIGPVAAAWPAPMTLDGQIFAEPLTCGNVVYVATENDSVYALNASTGSVLWRDPLGTPVPGNALPCGDIDPSGITGTPVIDVATGELYVVAFIDPGQHELFGINVTSGTTEHETNVDPPVDSPLVEQQRGALALDGDLIEIPYGGLDGDCGQYHGFVLAEPTDFTGPSYSYEVPTQREAGIWSPGGITVEGNGSILVATGNGASSTTYDFGDSVIELSATLQLEDYFAPTDWVQLNQDDTDLGSIAPTLLPNGEVFQIGKAGVGDLMDGRHLGGVGGQLYEANVCGGAYGGTAHVGTTILVPCTDGLYAVAVNGSQFSVAWQSSAFDAGSPIVTGDVVWTVDLSSATLIGLNLTSGAPLYSFALGSVDHFISPSAGDRTVFVGAGDQVFAFGFH